MINNNCYQGCSSVAVLYGTFTRTDGVIFTASMSGSNNGCTPCSAQNNAQTAVESVLRNFLADYTPQIIDHTYYIEYTNKCGEMIIDELCYTNSDKFTIEMKAFRLVKGHTTTLPDIKVDGESAIVNNPIYYYADMDCTEKIGFGIHNHVAYLNTSGIDTEILNPSYWFNNKFVEPLESTITNERTKQRIKTLIFLNLVQGYGGSNINIINYTHTSSHATVSTIGSKIEKNGFGITNLDGLLGISKTNYIRTFNDLFEYETNTYFRTETEN